MRSQVVRQMVVGARVVRGLDWKWRDQDGNPAGGTAFLPGFTNPVKATARFKGQLREKCCIFWFFVGFQVKGR